MRAYINCRGRGADRFPGGRYRREVSRLKGTPLLLIANNIRHEDHFYLFLLPVSLPFVSPFPSFFLRAFYRPAAERRTSGGSRSARGEMVP